MTHDALRLDPASTQQRDQFATDRVRFLPSSAFAHDFRLPPGTEGIITARFEMDGDRCLDLLIDGVPGVRYASGVPEVEVSRIVASHP